MFHILKMQVQIKVNTMLSYLHTYKCEYTVTHQEAFSNISHAVADIMGDITHNCIKEYHQT